MSIDVTNTRAKLTIVADSLSAMVDYASGDCRTVKNSERSSRRSDYGRGFHEYASWDEAMRHVFHNPERVAGIQRAKARMAGGRKVRTEYMRTPNRGGLNMGAYLAGDPRPKIDARRTNEDRDGKGKAVTIMVNAAASAAINADALARKGAAVLTLIDALESAGRPVEVIVGSYSERNSNGQIIDVKVTLKKAGQRMSLDALAFAIGSPDFFRRVIFGARERALNVPAANAVPLSWPSVPNGAVVIDSVNRDRVGGAFDSDAGVMRWVEAELAKHGVTLS